MGNPLMLSMQHKNAGGVIIQCTDQEHFDKLLIRFKKKGYKQIPYVEQPKVDSLPF
jgi:hypothetical protein